MYHYQFLDMGRNGISAVVMPHYVVCQAACREQSVAIDEQTQKTFRASIRTKPESMDHLMFALSLQTRGILAPVSPSNSSSK